VAAQAVIGGIGWIAGSAIGGMFQLGSLADTAITSLGSGIGQYLPLAGGVLVVLNLMAAPDGLAYLNWQQIGRLRALIRLPRKPGPAPVIPELPPSAVPPLRLEITDLSVNFGGVAALKHVSVTVEPGRVTGLIGPNGAGKTTLIDAATGFVRPAGGRVTLGGRDVTGWPPRKLAEAGLARSFQSLELFDDLSVLDNLLVAAEDHRLRAYVRDLVLPSRAPITSTTASAIREFRLQDVLTTRPTDLTYGMRRLVGIARAVATSPSVLLLDEPAAGLDETERRELGHLIRRLVEDWGIGVLLVEHDVDLVMRVSDTVYALDFGDRIAAGPPGEVRSDRRVIEAYLGEPQTDEGGLTPEQVIQ
jgi:ABC-type branched-subunit amino acid transport system ATPase component